jgi:hypothetical protein
MFTYKKTIFSYKQTNTNKNIIDQGIDNNLNSICNIFYIVNNVNFIDRSSFSQANEEECTHTLITNKINAIKTLEIKLLNLIQHNINLQQLNNDLLDLRTNMEKTIEANANTNTNANNNTMLNNIVTLLDNTS